METIDYKTEVRRVERNEFYQKFCDSVVNRLKEDGYEVSGEVKEVTKNNGVVYNGIQFQGEGNVQPVIYMDNYYDAVEHGAMTFDQAVERAATTYQEGQIDAGFSMDDILNYEKVKDRLLVCVRNAEKNSEMLKDIPHEQHEDLVEMYRIQVDTNDGSVGTVLINNQILAQLGVDQATLKEDAWACMKENDPGRLQTMHDVLFELTTGKFGEEEGTAMMEEMGAEVCPMYVYSNQSKVNGAVYMLDKESMSAVADKIGESFAILPSSIHECIIMPESAVHSYGELKTMVEEVNATQVAPDEVLSDNVYRFDKDTQELSMVETGPIQGQGITM